MTVNEILDDLVGHYKRGGEKGIPREVSPQMTSHLKPLREFFSEFRAMQVGSRDLEAFKSQLKVAKKANATINRSLQLLSQAYSYALKSDPQKLNRALMIKRYSEKGNVRKGKFTPAEAEAVFNNLPPYMSDVARFAYETGHRSSEIRKLCWSHLEPDAIRVPGSITKNGEECQIVLTEEVEEILCRRKSDRRPGCDLIFHHDGAPIVDCRKCWRSACVCLGLGAYYCVIAAMLSATTPPSWMPARNALRVESHGARIRSTSAKSSMTFGVARHTSHGNPAVRWRIA